MAECLCAGFEGGAWRAEQLADHIFEWMPRVALSLSDQGRFDLSSFLPLLKQAAQHIYNTKKTSTRGELGEILLHIACVLHHRATPVVCKLVLKSSPNDTVKGFDGIFVLPDGENTKIWLGESKFYQDAKSAISEAITSICEHILPAFLTVEKAVVLGHIPDDLPEKKLVAAMFSGKTSSDELIKRSVFPVLIAYDSNAVSKADEINSYYEELIENEVSGLQKNFARRIAGRAGASKLELRLILVPMDTKKKVVEHFDAKLKAFL